METIGSLTDKLSIVNIKLYHWEDIAQEEGAGDKQVAYAKRKINILNRQRNAFIEEIDTLLRDIIQNKSIPVVFHQFKDYGKK